MYKQKKYYIPKILRKLPLDQFDTNVTKRQLAHCTSSTYSDKL